MIDVVFISDLHLSPRHPEITERFKKFVAWATNNARTVYILGDFFHAWPGDDALEGWSQDIASDLKKLSQKVSIYFMHGNRDFLVGSAFAKQAGLQIISDPTCLELDSKTILAHGDQFCTKDRGHQLLRFFTRNSWFPFIFLKLPLRFRSLIVNQFRQYSQFNTHKKKKSEVQTDIVVKTMINCMKKNNTQVIIHGHTHRPGLKKYTHKGGAYYQYVLSDWDKNPSILCYNQKDGFSFISL